MRLLSALLYTSLASLAFAAYFSKGWQPGQPAPTRGVRPPPGDRRTPLKMPTEEKEKAEPLPSKGMQDRITEALLAPLTSGPVADVLSRLGFNASQAMEKAKAAAAAQADVWEKRIPLITDENYEDIIEYENLTPEEEGKRVWALAISMPEQNAISFFVDEQFDKAFNETMDAGNDLPDVRWGRINYMNVTMITTKWMVWKAPIVVIATDRGRTLRFYKPTMIRMRMFHEFLRQEAWKEMDPWKSSWAPGGDNAWILHKFSIFLAKYNKLMSTLPKWAIMMGTGMLGSGLISLLHGSSSFWATKKKAPVTTAQSHALPPAEPVPVAPVEPQSPEDKKELSKRRRAAKREAN